MTASASDLWTAPASTLKTLLSHRPTRRHRPDREAPGQRQPRHAEEGAPDDIAQVVVAAVHATERHEEGKPGYQGAKRDRHRTLAPPFAGNGLQAQGGRHTA